MAVVVTAACRRTGPISPREAPERSIFVASECRSRCAPTLGIPTLSQAAYTTPGDPHWAQRLDRSNRPEEHVAVVGLGAPAAQIVDHGRPDVARKWEPVLAASFAVHHDLPRPPVDIVETEASDLAGAKTEPSEQEQDGVISPADPSLAVAAGHQLLDDLRRQPARQGGALAAGNRWDGLRQRCVHDPVDVQEPQK